MNGADSGSGLVGPTSAEARQAVMQARRMFERTLASWACDLLLLRQAGRHRPRWHEGAAAAPLSQAA